MNKIRRRHILYSETVRYDKLIKFKKASSVYMQNRSSQNFDKVKRLSQEFQDYNRLHMTKIDRFCC